MVTNPIFTKGIEKIISHFKGLLLHAHFVLQPVNEMIDLSKTNIITNYH